MNMDVPSGAYQITAGGNLRVGSSEASVPARCSICFKPAWTELFTLRESAEALDSQPSWVFCKTCHTAVMRELQNSLLHSPVRVQIAVGLVAAERWPYLRPNAVEREERIWIVFLLCGFTGCVLIHLILLILLAHL
jgi:hypothetical protein